MIVWKNLQEKWRGVEPRLEAMYPHELQYLATATHESVEVVQARVEDIAKRFCLEKYEVLCILNTFYRQKG